MGKRVKSKSESRKNEQNKCVSCLIIRVIWEFGNLSVLNYNKVVSKEYTSKMCISINGNQNNL